MKTYILFSLEGRFIGFTSFKPETGLWKEINREFNPFEETYVGTYENGEIKNIADLSKKEVRDFNPDKKWVIYESALNAECKKIIEDEYPIYKQLNIITKLLYDNKDKFDTNEELVKMFDFIDQLRFRHNITINSYKDFDKEGRATFITVKEEPYFIDQFSNQVLNIEH